MAIIKCKMCGGDLVLSENSSIAECEYCGSRQTVPLADNEKKLTFFARAGHLRSICEFDKAAGIYETIVAEFPLEAEAYWGLVLCKYGIEYVNDPATGKKIPTCHRSSFDSVMEDSNFVRVLENADAVSVGIYRQEAKQIERIRRGILEVSSNEKPYDIFICYKETDASGNRTVDSLLAQDIYNALHAQGYRVFFSRISLEGMLGQAYEPYIFAALNSAKIMLAVGTSYENYHAVWVKNEWSRYIKIIAADPGKYLIPCYKGLDPTEDLPREFAHLQGQDMGKVGAIADLLRGIEKLLPQSAKSPVKRLSGDNKIAALLERGHIALEDGDWAEADRFFEEVLNNEPREARAYLGKLLTEFHLAEAENLAGCAADFTVSSNYQKALRFGDQNIQNVLDSARKDRIYYAARKLLEESSISSWKKAAIQLASIPGWRDADKLLEHCRSRMEADSGKTSVKSRKARNFIPFISIAAVLTLIITGVLIFQNPAGQLQSPTSNVAETDPRETAYQAAVSLMEEGRYEEAMEAFAELTDYQNSNVLHEECRVALENTVLEEKYQEAVSFAESEKYGKAAIAFAKLDGYKDAREKSFEMWKNVPGRSTISFWEDPFSRFFARKTDGTIPTEIDDFATYTAFFALKTDGTIAVDFYNSSHFTEDDIATYYTAGYKDIVSIHGVVGLRYDGTLAIPENDDRFQELKDWTDIVEISSYNTTHENTYVGLKADGTVVSNHSYSSSMSDWHDIIAVANGGTHVVGLKSDGTVLAAGNNDYGQCDVDAWSDITDIAVQRFDATFGLKSDGTIIATGSNFSGSLTKVNSWKNIIKLEFGPCGIRKDGSAVAALAPHNDNPNNTGRWKNIVNICTDGIAYTVGQQADGLLVFTQPYLIDSFTRAKTWTDIQIP